jgi:NADPH-dependent curcumin reductase CurA
MAPKMDLTPTPKGMLHHIRKQNWTWFRCVEKMFDNETTPSSGPRNLRLAVRKRLTLRGFIVSDHLDRQAQFYKDMGIWMSTGKIKWQETIVAGIENAPKAFIGLFKGDNVGKMLVRL